MKGGSRVSEKEYRTVQSEVFKVASRSRELGQKSRELQWDIEGLEQEIRMLMTKKQELVEGGRKQKGIDNRVDNAEDRLKEECRAEGDWRLIGLGVCSLGAGLMMLRRITREI